ncbi:MAG: M28 family peptidase [Candidatus Aminicenantales bacterium]
MRKPCLFMVAIFIFAEFLIISASKAQLTSKSWNQELYRLLDAWDRGDYLVALRGFRQIVTSTDDAEVLEQIALLTGSAFSIAEIAPDGRNPRFSLDGRYLLVDLGPPEKPSFMVFAADQNYAKIAEGQGSKAVFSPVEPVIAFLRLPDSSKLKEIREELTRLSSAPSPDWTKILALQAQFSLIGSKESKLCILDLRRGEEKILNTGSLLKNDLAFNLRGNEILLVAGEEAETGANQIYSLPLNSSDGNQALRPITAGPGFKTGPSSLAGDGYLLYLNSPTDPFSRFALQPPSAETRRPGPPRAAGQFPSRFRAPRSFSILDRQSPEVKVFEGSDINFSPRQDALVFISRQGNENILSLLRFDGSWSPIALKKTTENISSPVFSPDGNRLAYVMSVYGNDEVFLVDLAGKNEARITLEIQHDRSPRFLHSDLLLAIKGEPRHSRAHLYDLKSGKVSRLFHNETIRTIAPEYEWTVHPSGKAVVVVADRDGDTMSPERGVYLVDLSSLITKEELLRRIKSQEEAEVRLRVKASEFIKPLAPQINKIISAVSPRQLFEYQRALFAFDSKHVSQPGNLKAVEYIQKMFASFGYQPELQWVPNRPNKTANVIAVLKGKENPELYYLLSSHFDSNARGPGADDNTSATAVLLETARLLANHQLPSSLIFAAFTGEEAGFWGSREFARLAKENRLQVLGAINNDMIGWAEDHRLDNTIRYANAGLRDLMHAASIGFSRMVTYDSHYIRSTDAVPLYETFGNVVAGLGSYPVLGNPYYHTALDRLETVNQELIVEATKFMVATVVMMTSSPSPVRDVQAKPAGGGKVEITWSPNPERGIEYYELCWQVGEKGQAQVMKVKRNRAMISFRKEAQGSQAMITVRAVNRFGLPSWDAIPLKLAI